MPIAEAMLSEFDQEMSNTRKILERVPDGKWDWKPHTKSMSLGALSGHLATLPEWGIDTLQKDELEMGTGDYKPFIPSSTAALVDRFDQDQNKLRILLAGTTDEAMAKIWTMKWNGETVISMPRVSVVRSMIINHVIHHRAQLGVYLRLLDIPVPGMYGPSADEMPSA